MELRQRFEQWLRDEVGSMAAPALRRHLLDRGYHPERGFFRASGETDHQALLGILRQIWLVDGFEGSPFPEIGPAADR